MRLNATIVVGGDPTYSRRRTGIVINVDQALLEHALSEDEEDQDDAWQDSFDQYVMPEGFVVQPEIRFT